MISILESITALVSQRANLTLTLFDAILSGYKDPLTNSRIGSAELRILIEKQFIYSECYEHGEEKKLERIYELISSYNLSRKGVFEQIVDKCLASYTADLKSEEA